ncbi:unnamed protein product [Euphydryas editha]|uniref:AMP-dependent synthetase/ligase domain-containing protein n=1 Tax=Euphydryas editha TaxID=104508 RepID=A0AAU9VBG6_EUPED|nr:unnamed protein product [Euphydryas editha]
MLRYSRSERVYVLVWLFIVPWKADSLGCALRSNGFQKGDRLGIWAHNCAGWAVALVAAARVGLISVLINPMYEKDELTFCIVFLFWR